MEGGVGPQLGAPLQAREAWCIDAPEVHTGILVSRCLGSATDLPGTIISQLIASPIVKPNDLRR